MRERHRHRVGGGDRDVGEQSPELGREPGVHVRPLERHRTRRLVTMTAPVSSANVPLLVDRVTVLIDVYQPENRQPVVVQSAVDLRNVVHSS